MFELILERIWFACSRSLMGLTSFLEICSNLLISVCWSSIRRTVGAWVSILEAYWVSQRLAPARSSSESTIKAMKYKLNVRLLLTNANRERFFCSWSLKASERMSADHNTGSSRLIEVGESSDSSFVVLWAILIWRSFSNFSPFLEIFCEYSNIDLPARLL